MNLGYTTGIPDTPNNPSNDQPNMKINTNSINSIIGVDHIGFNANSGGYHNVIHFVSQASDPAPVGLVGELYTKQITFNGNGDEALFFQSGGGRITQLTTVGTASAAASGYSFLPGGIIMQWGAVSTAAFSGTTGFPITFPNNVFVVNLSPKSSLTGQNRPTTYLIDTNLLTTSDFKWNKIENPTSGVQYTGFYFVAIGN